MEIFGNSIPSFIEGGVTGFYPFEAAANMDVAAVREAYPTLQMMGGMDKMKLPLGKEAIDRELASKVKPIFAKGGFVSLPSITSYHPIFPGIISRYYRDSLNKLIDQMR